MANLQNISAETFVQVGGCLLTYISSVALHFTLILSIEVEELQNI